MTVIHARVGLQQRVLPEYRAPFFDQLAGACLQGLSVFTGDPDAEEAIETAEKLRIARLVKGRNWHISRGRTSLFWQWGLLSWLRQWNPHVLIVEANPRYLSTYLAMHWMHLHRRPVIGWGLGVRHSGGLESQLRKSFLRQLDAVIAYSRTGAEQYLSVGFRPDRVFIASNAVTARPADPALQRAPEFKGGVPSILYVGRLQPRKRVDQLIHACALLPAELRPHLVIVGDGPERHNLEELAWQVYPRTEFAGAKTGDALEPYFSRADLFVLPGTGGLAVQQAMAHALPVIVGEADGTQGELVRPTNGWLIAGLDNKSLRNTLLIALKDVPTLRRMGLESYRVVSEEVNTEAMVQAFGQAVDKVLRG